MTGAVRDEVPAQPRAERVEVADEVEHLVTHQLIGEAQLVFDRTLRSDDERVRRARPFPETAALQLLHLGLEDEGARRRDLATEGLGVESERLVLGDRLGAVVVQGVADAELLFRRQRDEARARRLNPRGLADRQRATAELLIDHARRFDPVEEFGGGAVHAGDLRPVDLDVDVLDPEDVQDGEQVLDGVHLRLPHREAGATGVLAAVLEIDGDLDRRIEVDATEDDSRLFRRGEQAHGVLRAGVQPDALERDFFPDRALKPAGGHASS